MKTVQNISGVMHGSGALAPLHMTLIMYILPCAWREDVSFYANIMLCAIETLL
jgi:hypothetical protein